MEVKELKAAIEAIVFVAEEPVSLVKLREIFPEESSDKLQTAATELQEEFNRERPGMEIREIAGGYRMTTRPEHHEHIRNYLQTRPSAKLSLPALESLAVIAYRQPITLAEILAVRGVKSSSALRTLMEKKFVAPCGRKRVAGRPILYCTTREFLVHFGLKDLGDLPTLKEFEDLIGMELPGRNVPEEQPVATTLPEEPEAVSGPAGQAPEEAAGASDEAALAIDAHAGTESTTEMPGADSVQDVEASSLEEAAGASGEAALPIDAHAPTESTTEMPGADSGPDVEACSLEEAAGASDEAALAIDAHAGTESTTEMPGADSVQDVEASSPEAESHDDPPPVEIGSKE